MSDYELISIFLMILTLLKLWQKKDEPTCEPPRSSSCAAVLCI